MKGIQEFDARRRTWLKNSAIAATAGIAAVEILPGTAAQANGINHAGKSTAKAHAGGIPVEKLEHIRPKLLPPPFVMEHEQATRAAPRVVEFTMTIEEKEVFID